MNNKAILGAILHELNTKTITMEDLILDHLYDLTQLQYNDVELTESQTKEYLTIVNYCHENGIAIDFGIEI